MRKVDASRVYRLLYPIVPAVVTATHAGRIAAMPVVSLVSLSNDPPLVGFSSSASHATYDAIISSGRFSVSWFDRRFADAVVKLGTITGATARDKLAVVGLHHRPGSLRGAPVIEEASATLECRFVTSQRFGDHNLVTGEVVSASAVEDFADYWAFKEYSPILYSGLNQPLRDIS